MVGKGDLLMAFIDREQVERILAVIGSKKSRELLYLLNKNPLKYVDVRNQMSQKSNSTAFYIKKLKNAKIIRVDKHYYFLTRIGIETIKLLKAFETVCVSFDLSDANADGIIKSIVVRNK